jgi:hypothetical protein
MTKILQSIPLAACVIALSTVGALAQTNPGHSSQTTGGVPNAQNPTVPGATGHSVVPGNNSTMSSSSTGTGEQRTGQIQSPGGGASGGGAGGGAGGAGGGGAGGGGAGGGGGR